MKLTAEQLKRILEASSSAEVAEICGGSLEKAKISETAEAQDQRLPYLSIDGFLVKNLVRGDNKNEQ
jgi:hypothetical protein